MIYERYTPRPDYDVILAAWEERYSAPMGPIRAIDIPVVQEPDKPKVRQAKPKREKGPKGRPKIVERCACGDMGLARAVKRGHKCQAK